MINTMFWSLFPVAALASLLTLTASAPADLATDGTLEYTPDSGGIKFGCKCAPTDPCWPSASSWNTLNTAIGGKLIAAVLPGVVCYPGPLQNPAACTTVATQLTNSTYVGNHPIALDYPIEDSCPASNIPVGGTCSLGDSPRYTVDATTPADVQAGVNFARTKGIRLVVRNTGHDLLGRSTGYGSLQIWIRHLRQGIVFQNKYTPSKSCPKCSWTGSAFEVKGGYVWGDVYAEAAKNDVIVVGGGDPTVGCIGGWAQGGGHSPANHDYGLGADQILEARVVLANGNLVTASACENTDLFFAIRGGGGGTYGIVVSTTIKAHPNTKVAAQIFAMAPLTDANIPEFMEALAILYSAFPDINDLGFNGYGNWAVSSYAPVAIGSTSTTGYNHVFAVFGKTIAQAQALYASTASKLAVYNGTSLFMKTSYQQFPNYQTYYNTLSGSQSPVGSIGALGSRLLDRAALTSDGLKQMLNTTAGSGSEFTVNNICLVGGGQVFLDGKDPNSGVLPGWRTSYVHNIVARGWAPGTSEADQAIVRSDITNVKTKAMEAIAPTTGSYMNEGDRNDPRFLENFYGGNVARLRAVKGKYDGMSLFYCPTCVGSDVWREDASGPLCRV